MRLVALRIPAGWTVVVNAFVEVPDEESLSEDLLQLRAGDLYLDLGWSRGRYRLELSDSETTHVRVELERADHARHAIDLILTELARDADPAGLQRLLDEAT
jgi:hypothetical protein